MAILRIIVVRKDLEFLYLVNRGSQAIASGVHLVNDVPTIHVDEIGAIIDRSRPNQIAQTASVRDGTCVELHSRRNRCQIGIIVCSPTECLVNRQLLHIRIAHYVGNVCFGSLEERSLPSDLHCCGHTGQGKFKIDIPNCTHFQVNALSLCSSKALPCLHLDVVITWR